MSRQIALILTLLMLAVPSSSKAQISVRSQLSQDTSAQPGESYVGSILIRNDTDEIQQAKIYQTDYLFQSDGSNYFGDPGTIERSNAKWIDVASSSMMVPPREAIEVSYRVNVPMDVDAEPLQGSYWSIIMVEGIPKSSPENIENDVPDDALGIIQVTRYGVQVATHIDGTGAANLTISESALSKSEGNIASLQLSVANEGDKLVRPEIWVELYDEAGNALGRIDGVNNRIYPGTSVKQQIELGKLEIGRYRALVIMDAGDDEVFAAEYNLNID